VECLKTPLYEDYQGCFLSFPSHCSGLKKAMAGMGMPAIVMYVIYIL